MCVTVETNPALCVPQATICSVVKLQSREQADTATPASRSHIFRLSTTVASLGCLHRRPYSISNNLI